MSGHNHDRAVFAAGAVCWRVFDDGVRVLVIHRTKYGDVTLPKGKVDPGETLPQTAVREVEEETGLRLALGVPLGIAHYLVGSGRDKFVHYWAARVSERAVRESTFVPNGEVAAIEWVTLARAKRYLSYDQDVEILDRFIALVDEGITDTFSLTVLRHAKAEPPSSWDGSDPSRPLTQRGVRQAASIVPSLAAWRPRRIVSSDAVRCLTTVAPIAAATGLEVKRARGISQEALEDGTADVRAVVGKRVRSRKNAILCSHGPVIPTVMHEIALATGTVEGAYLSEASALETAAFSIVHLSASNPSSGIITIETHAPRI